MHWALTMVTGPQEEPVTVDEAKAHIIVDHDVDDVLIAGWIHSARERVEELAGRALLTQTWEYALDAFPCATERNPFAVIRIPRPPLQAVEEIRYIAPDGTSTVLAASEYTVDLRSEPARVVPAYGKSWPSTRDAPNAVIVKFRAGWTSVATIPGQLLDALKLLTADRYAHREETVLDATPAALQAVRQLLTTGDRRLYVI
jgi:uncharacterized phiE125 gp8 family phage protein